MSRQVLFLFVATLVFALMACSGTMKGIDRYSGKRVQLAYKDEKFGSAGLQIKMPDGELFLGKLIQAPMKKPADTPSGKTYPAVNEFTGNTEAFLFGDRGNNMKCKFRLSDTVLGFRSGGFGLCEISDGRVVDIYTR
jgi:hypothetical protein